jgi:hypothetical protein
MKTISEINRVYIMYITDINYTLTTKRSIIAIMKLSDFITKLNILAELTDLANIFNQKETDILLLFGKNVHMINLNDSKSLFKSLYNLLASELEIMKIYLNIYLAKR